METALELAWLGGIIDGEGCIGVYRHKQTKDGRHNETWRPFITITNTNSIIIERSCRILERSGIDFQVHVHPLSNRNWKQRTDIQIVGIRRINRAVPILRPYVHGKAAQLDILYRITQSRLAAMAAPRAPRPGGGSIFPGFTDAEEQMVVDLKKLNACGRMIQG